MVAYLMMPAKWATPGLIFVNDVIHKSLSRESNYFVDLVM